MSIFGPIRSSLHESGYSGGGSTHLGQDQNRGYVIEPFQDRLRDRGLEGG